jgi:hypothetical protein
MNIEIDITNLTQMLICFPFITISLLMVAYLLYVVIVALIARVSFSFKESKDASIIDDCQPSR